MWIKYIYLHQVSGQMHKFYQNMDQENFDGILKEFEPFEKELASRGKLFFGGNETTLCHEYNDFFSDDMYYAFTYNSR